MSEERFFIKASYIVEICQDMNRNCDHWRLKSWFDDFCKGERKDNKDFAGQTLMEACRKSCGGCGEVDGMSG